VPPCETHAFKSQACRKRTTRDTPRPTSPQYPADSGSTTDSVHLSFNFRQHTGEFQKSIVHAGKKIQVRGNRSTPEKPLEKRREPTEKSRNLRCPVLIIRSSVRNVNFSTLFPKRFCHVPHSPIPPLQQHNRPRETAPRCLTWPVIHSHTTARQAADPELSHSLHTPHPHLRPNPAQNPAQNPPAALQTPAHS